MNFATIKDVMRMKWCITYFHSTGKYTSSKKYMFRTRLVAKMFYVYLKLLKKKWLLIQYIPKFIIDEDLDIDYQDCGPWRSYRLNAGGDNSVELMLSVSIEEIDQDGGTLNTYSLMDAPNDVYEATIQRIEKIAQ